MAVGLAGAVGASVVDAHITMLGLQAPWWLYSLKSAISVILALDINFITNLIPLGSKRSESDVPELDKGAASEAHRDHSRRAGYTRWARDRAGHAWGTSGPARADTEWNIPTRDVLVGGGARRD